MSDVEQVKFEVIVARADIEVIIRHLAAEAVRTSKTLPTIEEGETMVAVLAGHLLVSGFKAKALRTANGTWRFSA